MRKFLIISLSLILLLSFSPPKSKNASRPAFCYYSYKKLIRLINTPKEVAQYMKSCLHYKKEAGYPFKITAATGSANCAGYSLAAAALLSDNGYPPLIFNFICKKPRSNFICKKFHHLVPSSMSSIFDFICKKEIVHSVFVYKYKYLKLIDQGLILYFSLKNIELVYCGNNKIEKYSLINMANSPYINGESGIEIFYSPKTKKWGVRTIKVKTK